LGKKYTFAFNTDLGYGSGMSGRAFPIFKNYYVGGLGSVRGFQQSTLGPTRLSSAINPTPVFLGGAKKVVMNGEFIGPFPGTGNDKTLRIFAFVDAGYAYGEHDPIRLSELRSSYGVGLSWISPMGPLKFSYGLPLRQQTGDKIQSLQFQIGTSF
jgi:outer membrane protein insertion porin family